MVQGMKEHGKVAMCLEGVPLHEAQLQQIRLALVSNGLKILYRKFPTNECLNVEDPAIWIEASLGLLLIPQR